MTDNLKILHIEDAPTDAELIERTLKRSGITFDRVIVDTREQYVSALDKFEPDIVLSDHSLPAFNSLEALKILKQRGLDIPFILITATVSEEFAVSVMKEGASDYVLKDRLQRLPSAVMNAIGKYRSDNDRKQAEELAVRSNANLQTIFENTDKAYILCNAARKIISFNGKASQLFFDKRIRIGGHVLDFSPKEGIPSANEAISRVVNNEKFLYETSFKNAGGAIRWYEVSWVGVDNEKKGNIGFMIAFTDITDRKLLELERERITTDLALRVKELERFAYIISHDLRAPLANIIGASSLLSGMDLCGADKEKLTKGINSSAVILDEVVQDLNRILQAKSGINKIREQVHFSELVDNIKISISDLIDQHHVEIRSDFSEVDEFFALKPYLYSIFYNLISNSIKYRRQNVNSVIKVRSNLLKTGIGLTFADNGMGIDLKKNGDHIFGLYKRFHANVEGKGMGLFMVKTQVETLGGKISVKSEENVGTEFKIEFEL